MEKDIRNIVSKFCIENGDIIADLDEVKKKLENFFQRKRRFVCVIRKIYVRKSGN